MHYYGAYRPGYASVACPHAGNTRPVKKVYGLSWYSHKANSTLCSTGNAFNGSLGGSYWQTCPDMSRVVWNNAFYHSGIRLIALQWVQGWW